MIFKPKPYFCMSFIVFEPHSLKKKGKIKLNLYKIDICFPYVTIQRPFMFMNTSRLSFMKNAF